MDRMATLRLSHWRPEWYSYGWPSWHWISSARRVHPITVGVFGWTGGIRMNWMFSANYAGTQGIAPCKDKCRPTWPHELKVFTFERRQSSMRVPLILVTPILWLHVEREWLKNEATSWFMSVGTSETYVFLFFLVANHLLIKFRDLITVVYIMHWCVFKSQVNYWQ